MSAKDEVIDLNAAGTAQGDAVANAITSLVATAQVRLNRLTWMERVGTLLVRGMARCVAEMQTGGRVNGEDYVQDLRFLGTFEVLAGGGWSTSAVRRCGRVIDLVAGVDALTGNTDSAQPVLDRGVAAASAANAKGG